MCAKLCIIEEQKIYHKLYETTFVPYYSIEILSASPKPDGIINAVVKYKPDDLLIGTKNFDKPFCDSVIEIRAKYPGTGIIIFLAQYNDSNADLLRHLAMVQGGGLALFLKQSIDSVEQLRDIVNAVSRGQLIVDPALSSALFSRNTDCPFLRQMTSREEEILSLLANGYTNAAIARLLFIDLKTVEHHINNMYGKLKSVVDFDEKHPRVNAARLYLEATGKLATVSSKV